ncbi:hypothetical protein IAU60_003222 [Kwoniella sp. DSM 27419]
MSHYKDKPEVQHVEDADLPHDPDMDKLPTQLGSKIDAETAKYLDPSLVIDDALNRKIKRRANFANFVIAAGSLLYSIVTRNIGEYGGRFGTEVIDHEQAFADLTDLQNTKAFRYVY